MSVNGWKTTSMFLRSVWDVVGDLVVTPTAQFVWANGYHVAQRVAMPVILTLVVITEKLDQEVDQLSAEISSQTENLTKN